MTRTKWKLTPDGIEEWGENEAARFAEPKIPLLALLAADPQSGLVEIAPGVFEGPKAP